MFKKSRIKIVAAIMCVLMLLFAGTLCVIYFSSYIEVYQKNQEMLRRYAQAYWQNGNPAEDGNLPLIPIIEDGQKEKEYRLRSFHSVAFSENGEVADIDNDVGMEVADKDLIEIAEELVQKKKSGGVYNSWVYYIESSQGRTLVVLMDNQILKGNIGTLLRYTILFGSISLVILFLISLYLSHRIVQPLEESYQRQKQFISDAGHELKTPIAVVSTNVEILEREFGQSRWLDNVKFENSRMADLVRQLLELAKAESTEPPMESLDLSRIVTGGVLPFESIAFEKAHCLKTDIQDGVFIWGNGEQLGNLVSILVDNALNYAPEHSEISVELKSEHNRAVLSVSNEGKAIPEEQRKNLFERFYRADSSRGGEVPHYGLGLAIAKAIVASHHGKIEVACREKRVIFTVSFPINS